MASAFRNRVVRRLAWIYAAAVVVGGLILVCARPAEAVGVVGMAAVALAAGLGAAYAGQRRVRHRLHELRQAADALADGELIQDLRGTPKDDFVKLACSVERLAAQLREMVAEQDRLRQRLSRSEKLAVIGELAATVAHEVNNPLDGLQNSIAIIRRRVDADGQAGQLLDMMEAGLARIETTVSRLLSMSRDEPIQLAATAVCDIVDEALTFVQPRLNRHGIGLVRDFPAEPVIVQADVDYMAQSLINLMINAADAMKGTGGTLTLRCRAVDEQRACIEVADTGTGISEEHMLHIFEPFFSTKGKGSGTGLGLAVVARVVEAHHGRIEVQTQPGGGTTFHIELPRMNPAPVGEQVEDDSHDQAGLSTIGPRVGPRAGQPRS